jgi:hypothetical protein
LDELRAKFESALEGEKLERGVKELKLRDGYVGALERLKVTLGREGKLEEAAQVLKEIEQVKAGGEVEDLPDNADYRLRSLRGKWEREIEKTEGEKNENIAALVGKYSKVLDEKKRVLTRAAKIREALEVEKEVERVNELPSVLEALAKNDQGEMLRGSYGEGNVALEKKGAKASAPNRAEKLTDGVVTDYKSTGCAYGHVPCEFSVKLGKLYVISKVRMLLWDHDSRRYLYVVEVSADKKTWKVVADHEKELADSGWTEIEFDPVDVRYIRVRGIGNTMNTMFPIAELEAYSPER